jgi:uncharacterized protein YdeI (YjbR/CyaY-like superfamily)
MGTRDRRIDAYIARSADFAKPILEHLRAIVHAACPPVEETIRWGFPHFDYKGGMLCAMSAFKQHAAFGFWKGVLVVGRDQNGASMGSFGRITSVKDLPPRKALVAYIKKAMALNDDGVNVVRPKKKPQPEPALPADFAAALRRARGAWANWQAFPPSHRKEYVAWIVGAKQDATRERRMKTAVSQIQEGKSQNWKYETKRS